MTYIPEPTTCVDTGEDCGGLRLFLTLELMQPWKPVVRTQTLVFARVEDAGGVWEEDEGFETHTKVAEIMLEELKLARSVLVQLHDEGIVSFESCETTVSKSWKAMQANSMRVGKSNTMIGRTSRNHSQGRKKVEIKGLRSSFHS